MKTIKKIVNDRNKILIYENKNKKYVDKIFNSKNLFFFKKEKLGIKYFKKNKIFDIPKVYSYKIKNNIGIITSEYIEGKKTHVRKINQVYKSGPFISKKVNFNKYLGDLNNNYKIKKKKSYLKEFKDNHFLNKKIYVSKTHGDFVHYNCLEKDKKFYIIDFEKFRERIVVFDYLNWIIHPLTFRVSKYFCPNNRYLITKILNSIILFLLNTLAKSLTKKIFFRLKIDLNDFDLYYFLFLNEKIFIIQEDLYYVKDKKVKSTAYKHLKFLEYICLNLSRTMNKNYNKKTS
tara:strand:+ start:1948 stop:2814 length:867 start_codon:yes stop_codon:yes gene_type:complete